MLIYERRSSRTCTVALPGISLLDLSEQMSNRKRPTPLKLIKFKLIFLELEVLSDISLLNLFVSIPIVDKTKIEMRNKITINKIKFRINFFIFYIVMNTENFPSIN